MARRHSSQGIAQVAGVAAALIALQNGTARSKAHAAELTGTPRNALKPAALATLTARSPALASLARTNPLEITAEVAGEDGSKRRISMREALSTGAERCVAIMAELGPKVGKMSKEEERSYLQAARWLQMCRTIGLFGENEGASLPSELRHDPPARTDTPEHWQQSAQLDSISARMLTVIPEPEADSLEVEGN